jgi:hypothetical protein
VDEFNRRFRMHVSGVCDEFAATPVRLSLAGKRSRAEERARSVIRQRSRRRITERDLPPRFRNKLDAVHEAPPPSCERARLLEVLAATRWNIEPGRQRDEVVARDALQETGALRLTERRRKPLQFL